MTTPKYADSFPSYRSGSRPVTLTQLYPLPTQGRAERHLLYEWIVGEEGYVSGKFDDQRQGHDESLLEEGLDRGGFWFRQITQYYDRARIVFEAARVMREDAASYEAWCGDDPEEQEHSFDKAASLRADARMLEMKGQQALAKAMMTAKGCVESSIRVFGPLPKPGLSSGYVEEWT